MGVDEGTDPKINETEQRDKKLIHTSVWTSDFDKVQRQLKKVFSIKVAITIEN